MLCVTHYPEILTGILVKNKMGSFSVTEIITLRWESAHGVETFGSNKVKGGGPITHFPGRGGRSLYLIRNFLR